MRAFLGKGGGPGKTRAWQRSEARFRERPACAGLPAMAWRLRSARVFEELRPFG